MALNSSEEGQDAYSISALPDEGITNSQCKSQLAFLNHLEVFSSRRSQMCLDDQLNNQNYIKGMENSDAFSPCDVDIDIEKGNSETPKTKDETIETVKTEGPLTRALRGEIRLQIGDKFMQLLVDHNLMLPISTPKDKPATERVHDSLNNRSRKYKRSASFNSRKVVVLSSVLSSMGTMVLIYLTLRVRQFGDGFVHV